MASQGATLQNFNNELVKCIEDLREKREAVNASILKEEEEKAKIQKDLRRENTASRSRPSESRSSRKQMTRCFSPTFYAGRARARQIEEVLDAFLGGGGSELGILLRSILTDRLSKINEALARRVMARNEYDKTIQETEAAYMKILESSQTLLHVLKRETVNLTKKKQYST